MALEQREDQLALLAADLAVQVHQQDLRTERWKEVQHLAQQAVLRGHIGEPPEQILGDRRFGL